MVDSFVFSLQWTWCTSSCICWACFYCTLSYFVLINTLTFQTTSFGCLFMWKLNMHKNALNEMGLIIWIIRAMDEQLQWKILGPWIKRQRYKTEYIELLWLDVCTELCHWWWVTKDHSFKKSSPTNSGSVLDEIMVPYFVLIKTTKLFVWH